jgi:hypothetical protein
MAAMRRFATASALIVIQRRDVPGGTPVADFAIRGRPAAACPGNTSKLPLAYLILMEV